MVIIVRNSLVVADVITLSVSFLESYFGAYLITLLASLLQSRCDFCFE